MRSPARVLVFFPTHGEVGWVEHAVRSLGVALPAAHILVIDDASPDGTGELLDRLALGEPSLRVIRRPYRLGLGSAHKLAILLARDEGYDALVTLEAPEPTAGDTARRIVEALEEHDFVVGQRHEGSQVPKLAHRVAALALGSMPFVSDSLLRGYGRTLLDRLDVDAIAANDRGFSLESLGEIATVSTRWGSVTADGSRSPKSLRAWSSLRAAHHLVLSRVRGRSEPASRETRPPVHCRFCGNRYHVEVHPAREEGQRALPDVSPYSCASHSGRTHGRILQCLACGIVFMKPKLDPAALVDAYADVVDPVYLDNFPARLATFRRTLARIRPVLGEPARVLEVGSYCGAFLKVAREHGLDIQGVEPSAWAAEQAAHVTDAPILRGTLDDVPASLGPFDAIFAWDVVEHFADPVGELCKVNRLLPMGGRFFFCTLMVDNWFPRLVGSHWPWFMDMHLFYFTRATIDEMLRRSGFVLVESTPYRHITTVEYLLRKLGTLGLPGAKLGSAIASKTPWGKAQIPVRLGDIQLFSCTKVAEAPPAADEAAAERRAAATRHSALLN